MKRTNENKNLFYNFGQKFDLAGLNEILGSSYSQIITLQDLVNEEIKNVVSKTGKKIVISMGNHPASWVKNKNIKI